MSAPVVLLSGFRDLPAARAELEASITKLGGRLVGGVTWCGEASHVVVAGGLDEEYKEGVLGALAAGRWVVTRRWVDRSAREGGWREERAFVACQVVVASRERRLREGELFEGWKVVVLLEHPQRRAVYCRLLRAGGADVLEDWGLEQLVENQPGPEDVTLVVVDPDVLGREDPRHQTFQRWLSQAEECGHCPPQVYFKLVFESITQARRLQPETFSVLLPEVQERARKDGNMRLWSAVGGSKRPGEGGEAGGKRARQETRLVTTVVPANVVTIEDSDDDIEVLELRLAGRRRAAGGRTYREEVGVVRGPVEVVDLVEDEEDIQQETRELSDEEQEHGDPVETVVEPEPQPAPSLDPQARMFQQLLKRQQEAERAPAPTVKRSTPATASASTAPPVPLPPLAATVVTPLPPVLPSPPPGPVEDGPLLRQVLASVLERQTR